MVARLTFAFVLVSCTALSVVAMSATIGAVRSRRRGHAYATILVVLYAAAALVALIPLLSLFVLPPAWVTYVTVPGLTVLVFTALFFQRRSYRRAAVDSFLRHLFGQNGRGQR